MDLVEAVLFERGCHSHNQGPPPVSGRCYGGERGDHKLELTQLDMSYGADRDREGMGFLQSDLEFAYDSTRLCLHHVRDVEGDSVPSWTLRTTTSDYGRYKEQRPSC